jgi:hypothetical protein
VLTWVAYALAAAALVTAGRWYARRVDPLGRRRPFPVISVVLLGVLSVAAAAPGVLRAREQDRLARVASDLAGVRVSVHCQTFGEEFVDAGAELGYVRFGADGVPQRRTVIKYEPCRDLARYLRSGKRSPTPAQVVAVHVLTHEAMHLGGVLNEAVAECRAVQRDARTAMLLGAAPDAARALAARYWRDVYPRMPDDYRSRDCAPGGSLDERLDDAPWATA